MEEEEEEGGEDRGAASGVKRAVQREQSWPVQSLSRVGGGGDTLRSEAPPEKVWNFNQAACSRNHFLIESVESDETLVTRQRFYVSVQRVKRKILAVS